MSWLNRGPWKIDKAHNIFETMMPYDLPTEVKCRRTHTISRNYITWFENLAFENLHQIHFCCNV